MAIPISLTAGIAYLRGMISAYAGTGTQTGGVPVSIFTSTSAVANGTTVETDLISFPMPANTLVTNGQKVRITAVFDATANGNTKTFRVYFGATVVATFGGAPNGVVVIEVATVIRTGATSQAAWSDIRSGSGNGTSVHTSPAETLSGAVTIKMTGQSATASNDITSVALMVEWIP